MDIRPRDVACVDVVLPRVVGELPGRVVPAPLLAEEAGTLSEVGQPGSQRARRSMRLADVEDVRLGSVDRRGHAVAKLSDEVRADLLQCLRCLGRKRFVSQRGPAKPANELDPETVPTSLAPPTHPDVRKVASVGQRNNCTKHRLGCQLPSATPKLMRRVLGAATDLRMGSSFVPSSTSQMNGRRRRTAVRGYVAMGIRNKRPVFSGIAKATRP